MDRGTTKKIHDSYPGTRWPVCPERFPHPAGRVLFARSLAIPADHLHYRSDRRNRLAHLQTPAGYGKMVEKERSGR